MLTLRFLGTGPSRTRFRGRGEKRTRLESSALLSFDRHKFLIDVTRDFSLQSRFLPKKFDGVFLTHAHSDAAGGIPLLALWLKRMMRDEVRVPLYAHPAALACALARLGKISHYFLPRPLKALRAVLLTDAPRFAVTALPVEHSLQEGFPTYGYRFDFKGGGASRTVVYMSDVAQWQREVGGKMRRVDLLVLDGATWNRKIPSHLEMHQAVELAKKLAVKRLIFTQIGRSSPPHKILKAALKKLWMRAEAAYDGKTITI